MRDLPDEDLLRLSQTGAPEAQSEACWEILFARHRRRIALWCLRFASDREEAADLAQEILLRAWRHRDMFQGNSLFSTWLFTICRNHCLNHVKARRSRPAAQAIDDLSGLSEPQADPGQQIDEARRRDLMRQWMQHRLNGQERLALTLHYGQEMPLEAVTRLMGLANASGAKALLVSARRKLQTAVNAWRDSHEPAPGGKPDA